MTFSIAARCPTTGCFGLAISSSSPAVAARCAYVRSGVGAVATQNSTDPRLGPAVLGLMAEGLSASAAIEAITASAEHIQYRQLTAVDAQGNTSVFSGIHALGTSSWFKTDNCVAAGNLLASVDVPARMVEAFETAKGALGDRLIAAMQGGMVAGGEAGPVFSAGLLLIGAQNWPVADLRIDWDVEPISRLATLWTVWKPQMGAYIQRALDPTEAPKFGVPGDE